jgi:hypothetical protein
LKLIPITPPSPTWSGYTPHGLKEREASITNKLARGTFPATFFLGCVAALELDGVALEEI